jgi:hypothetical protein
LFHDSNLRWTQNVVQQIGAQPTGARFLFAKAAKGGFIRFAVMAKLAGCQQLSQNTLFVHLALDCFQLTKKWAKKVLTIIYAGLVGL